MLVQEIGDEAKQGGCDGDASNSTARLFFTTFLSFVTCPAHGAGCKRIASWANLHPRPTYMNEGWSGNASPAHGWRAAIQFACGRPWRSWRSASRQFLRAL